MTAITDPELEMGFCLEILLNGLPKGYGSIRMLISEADG